VEFVVFSGRGLVEWGGEGEWEEWSSLEALGDSIVFVREPWGRYQTGWSIGIIIGRMSCLENEDIYARTSTSQKTECCHFNRTRKKRIERKENSPPLRQDSDALEGLSILSREQQNGRLPPPYGSTGI